jgi:hypothetical protein
MAEAMAAAADELVFATLNCNSVRQNPFTPHAEQAPENAAAWDRLLTTADNCETPLSKVFTDAIWARLIKECADRGIPSDTAAADLVRHEATVGTGVLRNPEIGKKRLISLPERLTSAITDIDRRPAATNLSTGWEELPLDGYVDLWFDFMFGNAAHKLLGRIPDKYDAVTPAERAFSVWWQLFYLLAFDLATWHMLKVSDAAELRKRLIPAVLSAEEDVFRVITAMLATGVQVFALNEASRSLYRRLFDAHGDTHHVICATEGNVKQVQHSILMIDRTVGAPVEVVMAGSEHLMVHVVGPKPKAASYLLSAYHGESSGKGTAAAIATIRERAARRGAARVVAGIDANCSITGNKSKIPADDVVKACIASQFVAVPKPGDLGYTTVWGIPTTFNPQGHKGVKLSELKGVPGADQRDFVLVDVDGVVESVAVIASAEDVARHEGPAVGVVTLPSAKQHWASDHAAVVAIVTWSCRS